MIRGIAARVDAPSSTRRKKISALRVIGNHVRRAAALNGADVDRARAEQRIARQRHAPHAFERVQQFFDRRFAQVRIRGMRHAPMRDDLITQRAFRSQRELVLGRLAIDQDIGCRAVAWRQRAHRRCCVPRRPRTAARCCARRRRAIARTAKIMDAMMPLVSHAPRPQINSPSSRDAKNGGTVSMCVESVTTGSPQCANTLKRCGSTGMRSTRPPVDSARRER